MKSGLFVPLAAILAGIFTLSSAHAVEYTFTPIATSQAVFDSFDGAAINDSGVVTFYVDLKGPTPVQPGGGGIFVWNGGSPFAIALDQYADPNSPFFSVDDSPTINNAGTVAFSAALPTEEGLLIEYGLDSFIHISALFGGA